MDYVNYSLYTSPLFSHPRPQRVFSIFSFSSQRLKEGMAVPSIMTSQCLSRRHLRPPLSDTNQLKLSITMNNTRMRKMRSVYFVKRPHSSASAS